MCGISGIYRRRGAGQDEAAVRAMNARLARRGPDDEGLWREGPVTLGHRRLAILDLTAAGHQPMTSASGRHVIVFNGEIYNFREIARELGLDAAGRPAHNDTEVLLAAWERWGLDALPRLVGQWAFAVYDRQADELWLVRDRFGEKPLFYHADQDIVAFASSLPALLLTPTVSHELDPAALHEYLTLRFVVAPRTVVAGARKVPPGHLVRCNATGAELTRWYTPRLGTRARTWRRRAEVIEEFDALFTQAVRRCLVSDVPVALFLSDGIDSNGIHHVLRGQGADVPALTFTPVPGRGQPRLGETSSGGAIPVRVPVSERVDSMVPAFASLTEPVGDGAALATWLLVGGARERATVFLCGHGGDEILGGYRLNYDRFRVALLSALRWLPADWVRHDVERYVHGDAPFAARWGGLRRVPQSRIPDAARYLVHRPLEAADVREIFGGDASSAPYLGSIERLYAECGGPAVLDRIQEVLIHTFLSAGILSWADAVAMDSSAELRMPYLDRDLVEFACGLPPGWRASPWPGRANTKLVLRRWGQGRLPDDVLRRGKHGFPFGNLPELMASHGSVLRSRILDVVPLRRLLPGLETWLDALPQRLPDPLESTLWSLLALGIWCDQNGLR